MNGVTTQTGGGARGLVTLSIGGTAFSGWKDVSIERSLTTLAGGFSISAAAREDGAQSDFAFQPGAQCQLLVDGALVIDGWVDTVEPNYARDAHGINLSGRDRAADLVDCSAVHSPGSWTNTSIETIIADLISPFGLAVTADVSTGARVTRFAIQPGETVFEAAERLLRQRGLLIRSSADGLRIFTPKTGAARHQLNGQRVISAAARHSVGERYSDYIVKGQHSGSDSVNGKAAAQLKHVAKDPAVTRYRPLIIVAEDQATGASLEARAKWEAITRAGRAQGATLTIAGLYSAEGFLWEPDQLITVSSPWLSITDDMLIESVRLSKSEGGSFAELTVVAPEAWSQLAVPQEREAGRVEKVTAKKRRQNKASRT